MDLVRDKVKLEQDLGGNELLKKDLQKIVGYVTPYIPFVGLISGGVTVVEHMVDKTLFDFPGKEFPNQEPEEGKAESKEDQPEKEEEPQEEEKIDGLCSVLFGIK